MFGFLQALSQENNWRKQSITDQNKYSTESNLAGRMVLTEYDNTINRGTTRKKDPLENLIYINGNTTYNVRYLEGSEKRLLVKRYNGSEKKLDLNYAGGTHIINDEGYIVSVDFAHGAGADFIFLSPDLINLNIYKPFASTYKEFQIGSSDNLVCIYTSQDIEARIYKMALLDKQGNLKIEKEFPISQQHIGFHVEIINKKVFLFLNVYNDLMKDYTSKILAFDESLNQLWEKDYNGRVGYNPQSNPQKNELLVTQKNQIINLNAINGNTNWLFNTDLIVSPVLNTITLLDQKYVMDGKYVVVNAGLYNRETQIYDENILIIIDATNGNATYKEALGSTLQKLNIISLKKSFLLVKVNQIFEYKN